MGSSRHIFWATPYCLLDTSSGASRSAREMLIQLSRSGYRITIISATIFESEVGMTKIAAAWDEIKKRERKFITLDDGPLKHKTLVCRSTHRFQMTAYEEAMWFESCKRFMESEKPDYLFYYGGLNLDLLLAQEAKHCGLSTIFYLANNQYASTSRWRRDVDLIITDSRSTAEYYRKSCDIDVHPVGKFIDKQAVVADEFTHRNVLFVNPTLQKGASLVVLLALMLEQTRPDIVFEVVESRGRIAPIIERVTETRGERRSTLRNLVITPNQSNMKPVYGRARCVIVPSLGYESGSRVIVEAITNHLPVIATTIGGSPELVGSAGLLFGVDDQYCQAPYEGIPPPESLAAVTAFIERLYDDAPYFESMIALAAKQAEALSTDTSTQRLLQVIRNFEAVH